MLFSVVKSRAIDWEEMLPPKDSPRVYVTIGALVPRGQFYRMKNIVVIKFPNIVARAGKPCVQEVSKVSVIRHSDTMEINLLEH